MIRWEYKTYLFEPGEPLLEKLNQFGGDRWELIQFIAGADGRRRALFKRPIEPTQTTSTGEPQK